MISRPIFALSLAALVACPMSLFAAFQDTGWGARPLGMGGAFTAVSDDSNAPMYNPAGLVQVQWNEISANYSRLFSGLDLYSGSDTTGADTVHLDQSYVSYVSRAQRWGSVGVSWGNFNTTSLYREDTVVLSYANYLGGLFPILDSHVSMGGNIKYLRRAFTLDANTSSDPVFSAGDSRSAWTADVGFLWKPEGGRFEGWRTGLNLQNITQPDVGFREKEKVPLVWRLGTAYQSQRMPWFVPALDLTRRDGRIGVYGGAESWLFNDMLGLRAGAGREEASAGASFYQTFGKNLGFRLDYAFTVPYYVSDTAGSHRLGLTVYF